MPIQCPWDEGPRLPWVGPVPERAKPGGTWGSVVTNLFGVKTSHRVLTLGSWIQDEETSQGSSEESRVGSHTCPLIQS